MIICNALIGFSVDDHVVTKLNILTQERNEQLCLLSVRQVHITDDGPAARIRNS